LGAVPVLMVRLLELIEMPIVQPAAEPGPPPPAAGFPIVLGQTPVKLVAEAPPALNAIAAAAVPARRSEVSLQFISTLSPCSTASGHHQAICMPNEKLTLNQSFTVRGRLGPDKVVKGSDAVRGPKRPPG
jgi:hypothetical protein